MKQLTFLLLLIIAQAAHGQSLSVFDVDASNFPTIRAKFYAFDAVGNQIKNLSETDFKVTENGKPRTVKTVSCPPDKPLQTVSVAMSIDVSGSMSYSNFGDFPVELGKLTATDLCNSIAMPPSEFALQTCDARAMIIQDFTKDRNKILSSIAPIKATGDNDFVEHLMNKLSGLLNIAKTGKNKRVAVIYTDAWWYALTPQELQQCKDTCAKYNIQFYAVIYSRPEAEPNGIKKSLNDLADATGGFLYDGITSTTAAKDIARKIQSIAQGTEPCEITWKSEASCFAGITNYELKITNLGLEAKGSYQSPNTAVAKLEFYPTSIKFKNPTPGEYAPAQTVTVTAHNADFTINDITTKIPVGFDINPKNFPITLKAGQNMEFTVTYFPVDSGYNHCKYDVDCVPCPTKFYANGGWKGKKPTIRTIKLIHPNGGESFVAGSDAVITWEGVSPDEPVSIKYCIDSGVNWIPIADTATGLSYTWRVPKTPSDQCLAIVTAAAKSILTSDIEMVPIAAGTFQMGNTGAYSGYSQELPVHTVTISHDFLMSKYEITQKQYEAVMGNNPSYYKGENLPVEMVSWYDAVAFCNKLSELEGLEQCYTINETNVTCNFDAYGYRLPTEAEWEYAAKAGTSTDLYNGSLTNDQCTPIDANLDKIGWYCGNANNTSHPVGQKQPNAFGLYDMSGNVYEWCWDWHSAYSSTAVTDPIGASTGSYRVSRGGSWYYFAYYCRSAYRDSDTPSLSSSRIGFRIVSPI